MKILVTGGAGYIGSHTVLTLLEQGHDVEVVDNHDNSSPEAIRRVERLAGRQVTLHEVDLREEERLTALLADSGFDAVIHFAGLKAVGESVAKPTLYYGTNLESTLSLLRAMAASTTRTIVFSSSATVYGDQAPVPNVESYEPLVATNPYGQTKVMIERILSDLAASDESWRVGLLRYYNPVGAHPSGQIGEDPEGIPNNLTPFISQVAVGLREHLTVFGDDYDTPDGTGHRDYIHVMDLAEGHVAALDHLAATPGIGARAWNLGTGTSSSVLDVVAAFERASGVEIKRVVGPRRGGDLTYSYADVSRAEEELGWKATRGLEQMMADLWRWQSENPRGYRG
ncbi:UDP-glucose 4-epimerase GalE [Nocardioides daphniae]|uniref:UDP-glucose 4-epimerase n=1 Tax=Nocardioides daphniae TaxID=402297 RepID=A0A4V1CW88_9ACTN|nr:UDP-glucose 4-epimerase GalE [Nocardioides daphniae]QCC76417.1 UDP-glucose 4-epimerase GalE [Nocardioides daphniae]GGD06951.1 UDP-glucose 4-epimerase [Nocardioides daphniae]